MTICAAVCQCVRQCVCVAMCGIVRAAGCDIAAVCDKAHSGVRQCAAVRQWICGTASVPNRSVSGNVRGGANGTRVAVHAAMCGSARGVRRCNSARLCGNAVVCDNAWPCGSVRAAITQCGWPFSGSVWNSSCKQCAAVRECAEKCVLRCATGQ